MMKLQLARVKKEPFRHHVCYRGGNICAALAAIQRIPNDRMSFLSQMNSDLVGSTRFNPDIQQAERADFPDKAVMRDSFAMSACPDRKFLPVLRVAPERQVDRTRRGFGCAIN